MAVPLEKFVQQLEDSGIIAGETLKDFLPPKASPKSAEELALELVRKKKLTKFQAEEVSKGKGKSLILGNYLMMEKIGAGGMGQVFKAEHRRMHRIVAIKVLPSNLTKDEAAIARFEREVTAAAKLNHPNIVTAHDADEAGGVHFLVMELVEGSDLSALVKKNGPLPLEKAVNYVLQAARGLEAAHDEGIVHRDIKPANLLLDKKGTVKILDMGLARIHGNAGQAELTSTGSVMGTVDYMAPEQALNTKTADARADIYALGCSMYYLLTGKATFEGDTLMAKLLAHRDHPIPSLRSVRAEIPEQVEAVFKKMVAKKVEDRYQTMREVIAELESWGSGQSRTFALQSSDTGQAIPFDDNSVSSRTTTFPQVTRESVVKSKGLSTSKTVESSKEGDFTDFLDNLPSTPTKPVRTKNLSKKPVTKGKNTLLNDQKKLLLIGGAVLGVMILLAAVVINMRTQAGDATLVVTVTEPDAEVEVLNEKDTVEITRSGGKGKVEITVVPGKHRLRVQKDGFAIFTDSFEIKSGKSESITAELKPLKKEAVAGTVASPKQLDDLNFVDIFNGRDLTGWNVIGDQANWGVDASNGILTATGKSRGWLFTDNDYADFVLRLEYQTEPGANSGVAILASPAEERHLEVQISQIAGWATGGVWTDLNNTVDSGFIPVKQPAKEKSGDEWNSLEIDLRSRKLKIAVNGTDVLTLDVNELASRPNAFPAWKRIRGRIGLQSQTNAVRFRKVRVAEIASSSSSSERWNTPAFQQWVKDVQAMPAEKQIEAVSKKLVELNPGFDGKLTGTDSKTPFIENGSVTRLGFDADDVTDISPVRAFKQVYALDCVGRGSEKGQLSDLSPLKGMGLGSLCVSRTRVTDLSPLKGMNLSFFSCDSTLVSDISPLRGMPLVFANFHDSKVADLLPLSRSGMYLKSLVFSETPVSDVTPLDGMQLTELAFTPKNITYRIDVIRNMKTIERFGTRGWTEFTADEFWKKYDAGEFGKPLAFQTPAFQQWMKDVQALPAEKQVEAVSKKLMELNPGFDGKVQQQIQDGVVWGLHFVTENVTDISPVRALSSLRNLGCVGDFAKPSGKGKVSALSPLRGMALETLNLIYNPVADLSPLKGMPLVQLLCGMCDVSDLSPLREMPLTVLVLENNPVSDLSPLMGIKLSDLDLRHTSVSNLSPLKGMPLTSLFLGNTNVTDLTPLEGMKLTRVQCYNTKVSDLSVLKEMPLKQLRFTPKNITVGVDVIRQMKSIESFGIEYSSHFTPDDFWKKYDAGEFGKPTPAKPLAFQTPGFDQWIKDVQAMPAEKQVEAVSKKLMELNPGFDGVGIGPKIENGVVTYCGIPCEDVADVSPVRALAGLRGLHIAGNLPVTGKCKLSDLSPLEGMTLTTLGCFCTNVTDLSPLKGMPLQTLLCGESQVSDLTPLQGMSISHLGCPNSQVADLSPLKGMPLGNLYIDNTQVSDLTPLQGMKLRNLSFTPKNITLGIDVIRQMKTIETIGNQWQEKMDPAEFWKKYDAGEFGKPTYTPADAVQRDVKSLQGEWITVYEELDGTPFTADKVKEINRRFVFTNDELHVTRNFNGFGKYDGRFQVNPKGGEFDWSGTGPAGDAVKWKGIYQLTEDRLKVCFYYVKNEQTGRPEAFKGVKDSISLELKRQR